MVFPAVMIAAAASDEPTVALSTNAPIAMPGQIRRPKTKSAARAMPVGGQNGVTCPSTSSCSRPSFAAAK